MPWLDGTSTPRTGAALEILETYRSGDAVLWVSGSGSDSNSGLGPGQPKLTLAAAYAALPAPTGTNPAAGVINVLPGRYDVGAGLALTRGKPVHIKGAVPVPRYVTSTLTAPLTLNCAIIYSSTGAASLVTTIGGTAAALMHGCGFYDLLFEFSNAATKIALDLNSVWYADVHYCYGFADKTSGSPGPAAVDAQLIFSRDDATYGGGNRDCSWGRVTNNHVINMALGTWGVANGNNNQQVIRENVGLGLNHTNTSCKPFISLYSGHRCAVHDNNIEAYNVGIRMDSCYQSVESGDGGEFVDNFLDLYSCHGCSFSPNGIRFKSLGTQTAIVAGAKLVRMDQFVKNNTFDLHPIEAATFANGCYNPMDDGTSPSVSFNAVAGTWGPNVVTSANWTSNPDDVGGTSTTTPGAVATVNIAHGLGTTPLRFYVQAGNANARGAPAMHVTADATNVILNFASNLTAATSYAWQWNADAR